MIVRRNSAFSSAHFQGLSRLRLGFVSCSPCAGPRLTRFNTHASYSKSKGACSSRTGRNLIATSPKIFVSKCPEDADGSVFPNCDEVLCGELCEGDGECGTDPQLDNCPSKNYDPSTSGGRLDIYRKRCDVTTGTFIADDETIREAVSNWFEDRAAAEAKYGHISTWATEDLGWCVTDPYDDPYKDVFDPFDYDYTMEDAFDGTKCEATLCGVAETSSGCSGAAPGIYQPTPRPTSPTTRQPTRQPTSGSGCDYAVQPIARSDCP